MTFTDMWKSTTVAPRGDFEPIPVGNYTVEVDDAKLDATKDPNTVSFTFKIIEADNLENSTYENRKVWKNYRLDDAGIEWLKTDIATMGKDVETVTSIETLGDLLADTVDTKLAVKIVQNPSKKDPTKI